MKKINTSLINARMVENENLVKNALHYEDLLTKDMEGTINKAKQYLGLDENTPVTGFWEDVQKSYNVKTNTFIKINSILSSLKDLDADIPVEMENSLLELAETLKPDILKIYELEDEDLYIYKLEEVK